MALGNSEAEEPQGAGVASVALLGAEAMEVEGQCLVADMALIAARPRDHNRTPFNHVLGLWCPNNLIFTDSEETRFLQTLFSPVEVSRD